MNIFVLDKDPTLAAQYHCDKHCVKMILETAQLLCTANKITSPYYNPPYRVTHKNHPCSKWVRQSFSNYWWLCELGVALSKEYTHRYNKVHKSQAVIKWCIQNLPSIVDIGLTNFAMAMPYQYQNEKNIIESYRNYYIHEKAHFCKWTKREIPEWFKI